jgi:hypothetical protein
MYMCLRLNSSNYLCPLRIELRSVPVVRFLLALFIRKYVSQKFITEANEPPLRLPSSGNRGTTYVFQAIALVILQQAVLATVVSVAKPTVADDSLGSLLAVFVGATDFLGWHASPKRHGEVYS